ncbi:hypothetical protein K502DRAFT_348044 [Neoconidiobolus thromboides FSU 785]|nr:hypothetical protein K502DRAFT_348044 [Neoconidiobolus thromboides FSU 785]
MIQFSSDEATILKAKLIKVLTINEEEFINLFIEDNKFFQVIEYSCSDLIQTAQNSYLNLINKYLFLIVYRWSNIDLSLLKGKPIHLFIPSVPLLFDFITLFVEKNQQLVQTILENFLTKFTELEVSFINSRAEIVDYLRLLLKRLEKGTYLKLKQEEQFNFKIFVLNLIKDLSHSLFIVFNLNRKICSWYNSTNEFISTLMGLYPAISKLFSSDVDVNETIQTKKKYLKLVNSCITFNFIEPILDSDISKQKRITIFDQFYNLLIKFSQNNINDPNIPIYSLINASLFSDLSLNFEYIQLISEIYMKSSSLELETRSSRIEYLIDLLKDSIKNIEILPETNEDEPPKYSSTVQNNEISLHKNTDTFNLEDGVLESKISQIQEIFPDLSNGFIKKCLKYYNFDNEILIMRLLENELPKELKELDRNMEEEKVIENKNETSILSSRRNIHDNDEFDIFSNNNNNNNQIPKGIYQKQTNDTLINYENKITPSLKYNIINLSYDQYDDEFDEEDDLNIKSITTDNSQLDDPTEQHQSLLYSFYSSNPKIFSRDKEARKSKDRVQLRNSTNMSDEQIEGWATMIHREPFRLKKLEKIYGLESISQNNIQQNNNNNNNNNKVDNNNNNNNKVDNNNNKVDNNNNNSNKNTNNKSNQSKAYKEHNKAKISNHRRKDMRQKKINKQLGDNM